MTKRNLSIKNKQKKEIKQKVEKQPIAILCHWHTGSRLLLKVLNACGMQLGNEFSGYFCPEGQVRENRSLNTVTNEMFLALEKGNPHYNKFYESSKHIHDFIEILDKYKEEAEKQSWDFYGFKNIHLIHKLVWNNLGKVFESHWPNVKIVISLRHPLDIIKSTSNDDSWPVERILNYWKETVNVTKYLITYLNAEIIEFPNSYINGKIKKVVKNLGLTWNKNAEIFDESIINNISTEKEKKEFNTKYPEVYKEYLELQSFIK